MSRNITRHLLNKSKVHLLLEKANSLVRNDSPSLIAKDTSLLKMLSLVNTLITIFVIKNRTPNQSLKTLHLGSDLTV